MDSIALLGDLHLGLKTENPLVKKWITNGQYGFFDFFINKLKELHIKTILIAGDLHDNRQSINIKTLIETKRLLKDKFKDFNIYIILGNHDMYYENNYDITSLEFFEDIPNVTVYRNNMQIEHFLNKKWYMVPWIISERYNKMIDFLKKMAHKSDKIKKNNIIFGHFESIGIKMEGNSLSSSGMNPNLFLDAAPLTISGHYHGKSLTEKHGNKLLYLGSPYQLTFINADEQHGFWTLNENLEFNFYENIVSPKFINVWDTDDIDKIPDLSNMFVRFFINKNISADEEFKIKLKLQNKKPILIKTMPYNKENGKEVIKTEIEKEANKIMKMTSMDIAKIYMNEDVAGLPKLQLNNNTQEAVLSKLAEYNKTFN